MPPEAGAASVRLEWHRLLVVFALIVLFIPIRRYVFPGNLPFQLEPYRVALFLIIAAWAGSLLVDRRVRLRRTGFEGPLFFYTLAVLASVAMNPQRFSTYESTVIKSITFLVTFLALVYFIASVTRSLRVVDVLVRTLVLGGAAVAILAVIESRTGASPFDDLQRFLPFVAPIGEAGNLERGVQLRAMGSAEHPIALAALLVMLLPLALYLAQKHGRFWWIPVVILVVGSVSTISRTGIVMLAAVAVVVLILKRREALRLAPIVVPFIVVAHFVIPGALGTLRASFSNESKSDEGRWEDYGPSFAEMRDNPLGIGYGTRIVNGPDAHARILDNQWLASGVETGVFGVAALLWLFVRMLRRLGAASRALAGSESWLMTCIAASTAAYAAGMFTFDSFSFIQVTCVFFILIGLSSALWFAEEPLLHRAPRPRGDRAVASAESLVGRRELRNRPAQALAAEQP